MSENRKAILSFDDGPGPVKALDSILSTLAAEKIKAEFYLVGKEVELYPGAAMRIARSGHRVQNHSWSHPNLAKLPEEGVLKQVEKTQIIIERVTGIKPTKLRPPYGAGGWPGQLDPEVNRVATQLGLRVRNWDIDTEDWRPPKGIDKRKISVIKSQLAATKQTDPLNVLMHVRHETAEDLPGFISFLKDEGFTFAEPRI